MRRARRDFRLGKCIDGINGQGRCSRTDAFARIPRKEGVESESRFAGILAGYKHLIKIGSFMGLLHEPDVKLSSSDRILQWNWTKIKQQPSRAILGHRISRCLVLLHFLKPHRDSVPCIYWHQIQIVCLLNSALPKSSEMRSPLPIESKFPNPLSERADLGRGPSNKCQGRRRRRRRCVLLMTD